MQTTETGIWMFEEVIWVPYVRFAVVASSDGLMKTHSEGIDDEAAERMAAACAGLFSIVKNVAREYGKGPDKQHVITGFDGGFLFVRKAGDGSALAVVTDEDVDPGLVNAQMISQVEKIGGHNLGTPPRNPLPGAAT